MSRLIPARGAANLHQALARARAHSCRRMLNRRFPPAENVPGPGTASVAPRPEKPDPTQTPRRQTQTRRTDGRRTRFLNNALQSIIKSWARRCSAMFSNYFYSVFLTGQRVASFSPWAYQLFGILNKVSQTLRFFVLFVSEFFLFSPSLVAIISIPHVLLRVHHDSPAPP